MFTIKSKVVSQPSVMSHYLFHSVDHKIYERQPFTLSGVMFLHDHACPDTASHIQATLENFNCELPGHPPHSPNLAPSDYYLLTCLKNWLESQCFSNNEELKEGVKTWLCSQAADSFDTGITTTYSPIRQVPQF
jgi:hypothetical protein